MFALETIFYFAQLLCSHAISLQNTRQ